MIQNGLSRLTAPFRWWDDPEQVKKRTASARAKKKNRSRLTAERLNSSHTCPSQLIERIQKCASAVGHLPSDRELREYGLTSAVIRFRFGSVAKAFQLAGFPPREKHRLKNSREFLVQALQLFHQVNGRAPSYSDSRRGLLPSTSQYERHFGSWRKALKSAGMIPRKTLRDRASGQFVEGGASI